MLLDAPSLRDPAGVACVRRGEVAGGDPSGGAIHVVCRRTAEHAGKRRAEIHRLILPVLLAAALVTAAVIAVSTRDGEDREAGPVGASVAAEEPALAATPAPALRIGVPVPLRAARDLAYWAAVTRPVAARAAPSATAPEVGRLARLTPEGTANLVLAVGRTKDARGKIWTRVRLPVLPNNTIGWVPRAALGGLTAVRTRLVIDLERLTAALYRGGRRVFLAPVGVGQPQWPTPRGEFYVRNKLASYSSPFYGPIAFGTSARSAVLTDWPAGGFVGIHGTNQPDLLPGRISHGCIRLRNPDILRLARLLPIGTPLTIR